MSPPKRKKASSRPSRRPRRPAAVRALVWTAAVLAILFVAHAAVTRWLLSGSRLRALINTTPETTLLDWDEAVSIWPGRVRLKNFRIRSSDANVEWIVRIAEAHADYSLAALLTRTFRVRRLVGSGLTFRIRQKLRPSDPTNPPSALLPPISGFSDPPLRKPGPEATPAEEGNPWLVDVRGIALDRFEEIWFDTYHFQGHARLRGQFLLRPGQRARVGPAAIDFLGGRLGVGAQPLTVALTGRIQTTIDEWDPRNVQGSAVLSHVNGNVDLHGPGQGLDFLNYYTRRSAEPRFAGGGGAFSIAGAIAHGRASGRAELTARGARARLKELGLSGNVHAAIPISGWDLEHGAMRLSGSTLELTEIVATGDDAPRGWWGRFALPEAELHDGLRAKVKIECRDGRPLLAVLGVGLPHWTRGLLELDGLNATANVVLRSASNRIESLDATGGNFHILGEYARRGGQSQGAFLIDTGPLNVGVGLRDGHPSVHLIAARGWYEKEKAVVAQTSAEDTVARQKVPPAQR